MDRLRDGIERYDGLKVVRVRASLQTSMQKVCAFLFCRQWHVSCFGCCSHATAKGVWWKGLFVLSYTYPA